MRAPPGLHPIALLGLSIALAACAGRSSGPQATPTPQVVRVAAEPALRDRALGAAREALRPEGIAVELAAGVQRADITVNDVAGEGSVPFVRRYWVPVVALSHPATKISVAQLGDMFAGRSTDWVGMDGLEQPVQVRVHQEAPPLKQLGLTWGPSVLGEPLEGIIQQVAADRTFLAVLPLDALDARVRPLAVDGVNIVFGEGDPASYPLVERAWVTPLPDAGGAVERAAQAIARELNVAPPKPIILRATGDIIPARCAYARMRELGDLGHAFRELGPWLAEADITVGSLDAAVSDAGEPFGCVETFSLLAPAASVEGFAYAGFDVITVATNHVKDCGQAACGDQAFLDTLANLRAARIEPVGGGNNLAEARRPAIIERNGVRFAFLGYDEILPEIHAGATSPGTAPLEEAVVREDVSAAAAQAEVVVVLPQWGVEYTADPNERQRALARAAVEAGADLVVGNHPHWVQAAEVIDRTFVAYALGNFVFDQDWSLETQQGVVLEAAFLGDRLAGVRFHPVHIFDEHQPRFADPGEARQILDRIWSASERLAEQ